MRKSPTEPMTGPSTRSTSPYRSGSPRSDPPGLDQAAIDGLMQLVQDIDDLFRHKTLAGYQSAAWTKTENKPIFDPKQLKDSSLFTSLLVLTFRVMR